MSLVMNTMHIKRDFNKHMAFNHKIKKTLDR